MARSLARAWNSLGAGDEVGLAVDLDQRGDLAAHVDVVADQAFLGLARSAFLAAAASALLAQDLRGLVEIAAGRLQRLAAFQNAGAGRVRRSFTIGAVISTSDSSMITC